VSEPEFDKPEELAARLQVPPKTLAQWRSDGTGPPFVKIGRHVRYRRADVDRWLDGRTATTTTAA
jgi:excisionase family DNA binding protein